MNKFSITTIGFSIVSLLLFYSCQKEISDNKIIQNNKEYPNEWQYNQRAYPNNFINQKAIKRGLAQTKEIFSRKNNTGNWLNKGPINIGGRITDIAISPVNDDHFYIATPVGGVFKTIDRGQNWTPIFDNIGRPSIGNIEIAPNNANRIYIGTGEANASATSGAFFGDGMYRSDDAGISWTHIGLEDSQHIGRIVVDPNNENRVFVAATGTLYGKNEERGVYRSTNAGTDWERVLFVSDSTAVIDIVMNPINTNTLFAATWERTRKPWQRNYGGESSGVYRSFDGGDNWSKLANGLPISTSETGRIGLAISESNPSTIYATYTTNAITNTFDRLFKSTDNGDSWNSVSLDDLSFVNSSFGWYFGNIRVHPTDPDEVYILGQRLVKSANGGSNFSEIFGMHVDYHAMEYSRNNADFILMGNDGGIYKSENGGNTWSHFSNIPITQFYNIEIDNLLPERIYGGTQDNNTLRTLTGNNNDYTAILGGDGFQVNVDPTNSNFVYAEYQFGNLFRSTDGGFTMIYALNGVNQNDRTNWNTPVEISPFNSDVLFYGANNLYKSTDNAQNWVQISNDLTSGQHPSGSLSYGTLTCIAPSYQNLDVIYTGSDDGNVSVTFNGGNTWQSIDADLPNRFVSQITIHPNNDLIAYATFSGFGFLDYTPHIYKTINGGQDWQDISSNLPSIPINDVVISASDNLLYIATDMGVWYSENDGTNWDILGDDLPITIAADIKIHEPTNTLYVGTFGRSIFSYDLSQITASINNNEIANLDLSVYPNPITDNFTLAINSFNSAKCKIYITDINGKISSVLYEGIILEGKQNLTLNNLESGIYFLHVQTNNKHLTKKIIVKK